MLPVSPEIEPLLTKLSTVILLLFSKVAFVLFVILRELREVVFLLKVPLFVKLPLFTIASVITLLPSLFIKVPLFVNDPVVIVPLSEGETVISPLL